jgi:outer membrane protein assembly factor BamB
VVELDAKGAVVWEVAVDGDPHDAHRLANGNTLIASYSGNTVIEVDKDGKVVWKKECRSPVRAYK